jgi:hypothetical protein
MIDRLVYINQMLNENLHYMYSINNVKFYEITSNDLEAFREELEILKIIKNKKVDMTFFVVAIHSTLPIDEQINYYNIRQCNYCKLTDEEFRKLKQWLEESK